MIVDTRNPEVSAALAEWFTARDRLFDLRQQAEIPGMELAKLDEHIADAMETLVDLSDEVVAFLAPDATAYREHMLLNGKEPRDDTD